MLLSTYPPSDQTPKLLSTGQAAVSHSVHQMRVDEVEGKSAKDGTSMDSVDIQYPAMDVRESRAPSQELQ